MGVVTVQTVRRSNFCSEKKFCWSAELPDRLWGPPSLLFNGYHGSSPGLKRPGRDVHNSSLSSAEVENKWSCTSAPPICLRDLFRDSFTHNFLFNNVCSVIICHCTSKQKSCWRKTACFRYANFVRAMSRCPKPQHTHRATSAERQGTRGATQATQAARQRA